MHQALSLPAPPAHSRILRTTGLIVAAIGALQLAIGLIQGPPGRFHFELLGLAAGLAILFGGFRVVSAVRWLACLSLVPAIEALLTPILLTPGSLAQVQLRLFPGAVAAYYLPLLLTVFFVAFAAYQLGRPPVLVAREAAGRKRRDMRIPLVLGLALALLSFTLQYRLMNGDEARQAARMAEQKLGPDYRYFTNVVHISYGAHTQVNAMVQVWNEDEAFAVSVNWRREAP